MVGKIYLVGSIRLSRDHEALQNHFEVCFLRDLIKEKRTITLPILEQLTQLLLLFHLFSKKNGIVVCDAFELKSFIIAMLCKITGTPFYLRIRGAMGNEYEDAVHYRNKIYRNLYKYYRTFIRNRVIYLSDKILPVSYFLKTQIIQETNVDPRCIHVVYEPVDIETITGSKKGIFKQHLDIPQESNVIITITNFHYRDKYNGILYFSPAINEFLVQYSDCYFVIVGTGASLRNAKSDIYDVFDDQVLDRVLFAGHYDPIGEALKDSDILLHLSFRDTMGMPVLEGQAAHKPVIVNFSGGLPELLRNRNSNLKTIVNEPPELFEALSSLMDSKEYQQILGDYNYRWVKKNFTSSAISNQFLMALPDSYAAD